MKQILLAITLTLGLLSCDKINTEIDKKTPKYCGTMIVGKNKPQEDIEVQLATNKDSTILEIKMLKIKFVDKMPVRIDLIIPGIAMKKTEVAGVYSFEAEEIIPFAMGGYWEKYTVYNINGTFNKEDLKYNFTCYESFTTYEGKKN